MQMILAVLLAVVVATEASPRFCDPVYVTKLKEVYDQVGVTHTVVKTNLVPTVIHVTDVREVTVPYTETVYLPKHELKTVVKPVDQYHTQYLPVQRVVTKQLLKTKHVTYNEFFTKTVLLDAPKIALDHKTAVSGVVQPVLKTVDQVVYKTVYDTKVVPTPKTVVSTRIIDHTVCPSKYGSY